MGVQESGSGSSKGSDVEISPDLLSSVQESLDDTFGGADDASLDREASGKSSKARDAAERHVTVRSHKRRVRSKPEDQDLGESQWGEDPNDPIHDEGGDDNDKSESSDTAKSRRQQQRAEKKQGRREDQDSDDDAGDDTPPTDDEFGGIPQHLIEAARRRKWSDERIQKAIKLDPEGAAEIFQQLHDDANSIGRQFAEIGRALKNQGQLGQQAPQGQFGLPPGQTFNFPPANVGNPGFSQQGQVPPASQQISQAQQGGIIPQFEFPKEALTELDDSFKTGVVAPIQEHMNKMAQAMNFIVQQQQQAFQETQRAMLQQQVDQFFGGLDRYEKVYGGRKEWGKLTEDQRNYRIQVLQEADAIRAGAIFQGRDIGVLEAMEMAHNLVTSQFQRETARRDIRSQVQSRSRQASIRPSNRVGADHNSSDPLAKAHATAARKLRELGGSR